MPTTHKARLSDVLKIVARRSTSELEHMEIQKAQVRLAETASTGTTDRLIFHAHGPVVIKRIVFVPEVAVSSASSTKWVATFFKNLTISLGTYSTYASDTTTRTGAFVVGTPTVLYAPTTGTELELVENDTLSVDLAETGTAADFQGLLITEYVPVMG